MNEGVRLRLSCAALLICTTSSVGAQTAKRPAPEPSVRALLQLAQTQSARKDLPAALATLTQARALAPNSEGVLRAYAEAALAAREPLQAIPALESLTRLHPKVGQYHYLEGDALMQAGDAEAAAAALKKAQQLEPNRPLLLIALGIALNERGLHQEAKTHLLRALSLEPESLDAAAALAQAEEGLGELEAAEARAQRVLAKLSTQATANLVAGTVLMKQGRDEAARDALQKAVAADPSSPAAHDRLSLAYERLGDQPSAQKHRARYRQLVDQRGERAKRARRLVGFSPADAPP